MDPSSSSSSVLVVDDEPQVVWMLKFSLEAEGYQTFSARDGQSALDELRLHRPQLRIIVVSARASMRDRAKAVELGADAFVSKPFNVDDLLGVLHSLAEAS